MKILQVVPVLSSYFGGPVRVVQNISKELVNRGHKVTIYTTTALDWKKDIKPREKLHKDGYKVVFHRRNFNFGAFRDLNISLGIMNSLRKNLDNFDIIHLHSWRQFSDMITYFYSNKRKIPYILQPHGSLIKMTKLGRKWLYDILFGSKVLQNASKFIALTKVESNQYSALGFPKEKIRIVPNGIDLSKYNNLPTRNLFKKRFNIDENKKVILFLGRIHKIKGIDLLIKAYANLLKDVKFKDILLVIVGPDDGYLKEAKLLVKFLKIDNNVLFTGPLYGTEKLEAFIDAEIYVLPSRYETFPMTVLEAMACNIPIILSENCGIIEVIQDNVGLVVKPSPDGIQDALLKLLSNKISLKRFRDNCRLTVKRFDLNRIVSMLENVYEEVVQESKVKK